MPLTKLYAFPGFLSFLYTRLIPIDFHTPVTIFNLLFHSTFKNYANVLSRVLSLHFAPISLFRETDGVVQSFPFEEWKMKVQKKRWKLRGYQVTGAIVY